MKRSLRIILLVLIIATILMGTAFGAEVGKTIDAVFNKVNIRVNNEKVSTDNLLYEGTTYVPLRAVSEMLGKEVGWDASTKTASINDTVAKPEITRKGNAEELKQETKKTIKVTYNSVNIAVNGKKVSTDNILYQGTTYVPLRAISEMLDKEVGWDGKTNTASINDIGTKVIGTEKEDLEELRVHYIDVGQGDSIFIELPNKENILIDGGTKSSGDLVLNYLKENKVSKIDYLVATHPHEDHIGGLIEVINNYPIGEIYMPDVTHTSKTFENLLIAINNKSYKINKAIAGNMVLDEKDLKLKILAPEKDYSNNNLNNYSVVVKLNYKDNSFLFTGDTEKESESNMVSMDYDLKSDVLKAGHHGSNTSTTDSFLSKVNPKYVVICCGLNNIYGHPDSDIIKNLQARNIQIFRTDLDGSIIARSDGKNITFDKKPSTLRDTGSTDQKEIKEEVKAELTPRPEAKPEVQAPVTDDLEEVYITKTGTKYHRPDCNSLRSSKIAISLEEAKKRFEPCNVCKP